MKRPAQYCGGIAVVIALGLPDRQPFGEVDVVRVVDARVL
jgi:hypothetical protein